MLSVDAQAWWVAALGARKPHCSRWEEVAGAAPLKGRFLIQGGLWSLVSLSVLLAGLLPYQEPFQFPVPCDAASPVSGGRSSRRNSMGGFPTSSVQPNRLFDLGQTLTFRGPLETWP